MKNEIVTQSNAALATFADMIEGVDIPATDRIKRIYWHNGVKQAGTPGMFYTSLKELGEAPGAPWTPVSKYEGEAGYVAEHLRIIVYGYRTQPYTEEKRNGMTFRTWLPEWVDGARLYTEFLCAVQGIDGVCVLPVKGLTGKAFREKSIGILPQYRAMVLGPARTMSKKQLPDWSFWLPVSTELDQRGKTIYTDTGHGSFITRPVLSLPNLQDAELFRDLFAGADMINRGFDIVREHVDWFKTKRVNEAAPERQDDVYPELAHQPRNVPQQITSATEIDY